MTHVIAIANHWQLAITILKLQKFKSLLMPLFLMGCFPVDFQEEKRLLRTKSRKRPIKVGKRPIKEGKRPVKAMVLVGNSVSCLMGCFRAPPPWRTTAPLKRPIKRSMRNHNKITVPQSQKSHWPKRIATILNHGLVVTRSSGVTAALWSASRKKTGGSRAQIQRVFSESR